MLNTNLHKILRLLSFGLFAIITLLLMAATVVEKLHGTELVQREIYTSWWMIALWGVATLFSLVYLWQQGVHRRWRVLLLHLSFVVIIVGALITHLSGREGSLHLRVGESATCYTTSDGTTAEFPFEVTLKGFELQYYEGTFAPMDYVSHVVICDTATIEGRVSMNNILRYRGYRLYQSGYDADGNGATLSVAYDPAGIGVTYTGYALLLLSIILFFFDKNSVLRSLLRHPALRKVGVVVAFVATAATASATERSTMPKTLSREAAATFCDVYVYHNDRIAPLQTLAIEFTTKLYGKTEYRGLSAEQVLTGWFFFYDDWKHEPIIKIKGDDVCSLLGIEGRYARLTDFTDRNGYKLDAALRGEGNISRRNAELANEKFNLVSMLCMGTLLKIYPYADPDTKQVTWYSLADTMPATMSYEEWLFVSRSMNLVAERVMMHDEAEVMHLMKKVRKYQQRQAADVLPSENRFRAEKFYNSIGWNRPIAMACLTFGICVMLLFCFARNHATQLMRWVRRLLYLLLGALFLYLSAHIALRGYISGHVPLSNGYETMMFMSWCSVLITMAIGRKMRLALPFGLLLAGFTLLVAMMGESSPRITQLMPVLQSPLLSIHVVVIMLAYTLFAFMTLNALAAIVIRLMRRDSRDEVEYLYVVSRIMLYFALFLLAIGIFVGAVWANVSWGRYWGWDPKEVWALITMLLYAALLHCGSFPLLRRPMVFHALAVLAFFSVLITYFGVNMLLGGMHSYA